MPLGKYFQGHGKEVQQSMRDAHPGASDERIKQEFYATANKTGMKPGGKKDKAKKSKPGIIGSRIKASDI